MGKREHRTKPIKLVGLINRRGINEIEILWLTCS